MLNIYLEKQTISFWFISYTKVIWSGYMQPQFPSPFSFLFFKNYSQLEIWFTFCYVPLNYGKNKINLLSSFVETKLYERFCKTIAIFMVIFFNRYVKIKLFTQPLKNNRRKHISDDSKILRNKLSQCIVPWKCSIDRAMSTKLVFKSTAAIYFRADNEYWHVKERKKKFHPKITTPKIVSMV